jgi:hypothetical protein
MPDFKKMSKGEIIQATEAGGFQATAADGAPTQFSRKSNKWRFKLSYQSANKCVHPPVLPAIVIVAKSRHGGSCRVDDIGDRGL